MHSLYKWRYFDQGDPASQQQGAQDCPEYSTQASSGQFQGKHLIKSVGIRDSMFDKDTSTVGRQN